MLVDAQLRSFSDKGLTPGCEVLTAAARTFNSASMPDMGALTTFYDEIKSSENVFKFYVNGEWRESTSGKTVSVLNPSKANEETFKVQACTQVSRNAIGCVQSEHQMSFHIVCRSV